MSSDRVPDKYDLEADEEYSALSSRPPERSITWTGAFKIAIAQLVVALGLLAFASLLGFIDIQNS